MSVSKRVEKLDQNPEFLAADAFRKELLRQYPGRQRTIDAIWSSAIHLIENDETLSYAAVGKFAVSQYGGPRGQSIQNNEDYKKLVLLLKNLKPSPSKSTGTFEQKLLALAQNDADRSRIRQLIDERRILADKVQWLQKALETRTVPLTAPNPEIRNLDTLPSPQKPDIPVHAQQELTKLIDAGFWASLDCEVRADGVYIDDWKILDRAALDYVSECLDTKLL